MKVKEFLAVLSNRMRVHLEQRIIAGGIDVDGNAYSLRKTINDTVGNAIVDHTYIEGDVLHVLFDLSEEVGEQ